MSRPSARRRWEAWQASPRPQRGLTADERRQGYTVVHIPPHGREAFLDLLPLLAVVHSLASRREPPGEFVALWRQWQRVTREVTGALQRLRDRQPVTPPDLAALARAVEARDAS
jgi:hypothetical protein